MKTKKMIWKKLRNTMTSGLLACTIGSGFGTAELVGTVGGVFATTQAIDYISSANDTTGHFLNDMVPGSDSTVPQMPRR